LEKFYGKFEKHFNISKCLGIGANGHVFVGTEKKGKKEYAIKR